MRKYYDFVKGQKPGLSHLVSNMIKKGLYTLVNASVRVSKRPRASLGPKPGLLFRGEVWSPDLEMQYMV